MDISPVHEIWLKPSYMEGTVKRGRRPGVRQVPGDSGEQRKMEETGCDVNCGALKTLAVKGQVKVKKVTSRKIKR